MEYLEVIRLIIDITVILIAFGISFGVVKTKVNLLERSINDLKRNQNCYDDDLLDIKERLARLEQKVDDILNFLKRR